MIQVCFSRRAKTEMRQREKDLKRINEEERGIRQNNSESERKREIPPLSSQLALIKTAASLLIVASITCSLWSKVVASSCYVHKDTRTCAHTQTKGCRPQPLLPTADNSEKKEIEMCASEERSIIPKVTLRKVDMRLRMAAYNVIP